MVTLHRVPVKVKIRFRRVFRERAENWETTKMILELACHFEPPPFLEAACCSLVAATIAERKKER